MTPEQEAHLQHIKTRFVDAVDTKYRAGAKEHGSDLMSMNPLRLLDEAIAENIDQFTYLLTLRDEIATAAGKTFYDNSIWGTTTPSCQE